MSDNNTSPTDNHRSDSKPEGSFYFEYFHHKPGRLPGTLQIDEEAQPAKVVLFDYDGEKNTWMPEATPKTCAPFLDSDSLSWIDIQGVGGVQLWEQISEVFGLHPLAIEDVVNVPQRPKVEEYDNCLLIVARMVLPNRGSTGFHCEQVSLILGDRYLLTVQETSDRDCFDGVREQLRSNKGTVCRRGVDYLAYALLDATIEGFFPVLEVYGERIEQLEEEVVTSPTPQTLKKIYQVRRELLGVRRAIWPQRSAINILSRGGGDTRIGEEVRIYWRDCYDRAIQVLDMLEIYRELASGMMDVYLSAVNNKMNEVMKILTVISTIFIPLTFIVGVYGMNFNPEVSPWNMPELNWYWGYPATWAVMVAIASGLIIFFWRRGWFENFSNIEDE